MRPQDPGQKPFTYNAGVQQVITGWDQGCLGMAVGEVRKLDIPAVEGYGSSGMPCDHRLAHPTLARPVSILCSVYPTVRLLRHALRCCYLWLPHLLT